MTWEIRQGRNLDLLAEMLAESVQTCITSPPYWGLRDYGEDDQLGLEPTPEEYVENMVAVFREVRRVLRDDGTVWLNLGDSYAGARASGGGTMAGFNDRYFGRETKGDKQRKVDKSKPPRPKVAGLKDKDLVGIPWRVAFALQADGWYLRSDIIWHKPNPMPESVTDRPTKSHEYIFLLTKQPRYYYDAEAIREDSKPWSSAKGFSAPGQDKRANGTSHRNGHGQHLDDLQSGRNRRSVWTVTTKPFCGAHFAVFPPDLIEPCVLAGSSPTACGECAAPYERIVERERKPTGRSDSSVYTGRAYSEPQSAVSGPKKNLGGSLPSPKTVGWQPTCDHSDDSGRSVVLDPFSGSGTTGMVALRHGRSYLGLELNPEYAEMSRNRIRDDAPLLNTGLEVAA